MDIREYHKLITDLWQFLKKHLPARSDDEYWQQLTSETKTFAVEHGDTQLTRDLVMAVVNELDRVVTGE